MTDATAAGWRTTPRAGTDAAPAPSPAARPSPTRFALPVACVVAALCVGWRLVDLAEWPYPFHTTVQYESALAARAVWVAADPAARTPDRAAWFAEAGFRHVVSPPLLPALVAGCYAVAGDEIPWVSKLFTAAFWCAAGWLIYAAVRRQTGCRWAGVVAFGWFAFTPYGVLLSRSFQTDPGLLCGYALAVWHLSRPGRGLGWRETAAAGLACGLAAAVKPGAVLLPLAFGYAASVLSPAVSGGLLRRAACAALFGACVAVPSVAYALTVLGGRGGEIQPQLLGTAKFYQDVGEMLRVVVGYKALAVGLAGAALAAARGAMLPLGLFAGHAAFAAVFTYHCSTHDYYHAPVLVTVAVGIGWLAAAAVRLLVALTPPRRVELVVAVVVVAFLARYVKVSRTQWGGPWRYQAAQRLALAENDRVTQARADAGRAAREAMRPGARAVAVTEEYGYPFEFWAGLRVSTWPRKADLPFMVRAGMVSATETADDRLTALIASGHEYVVVTDFAEYALHPDLQAAVARRGRVVASTPGLLVVDLRP